MKEKFSLKGANIRDVRTLTGSALLIALAVIIDFFRLAISNLLEISFEFVAYAVAGILYGPIIGGMVGGISDVIQYVIRPSGPFFPGFTLNAILSGFIFGLFLYNRKITVKRVALAVLVEGLVVTLLLTPLWLSIMYGAKIFALPRIIKFVAMFPLRVALIYGAGKVLEKQRLTRKFKSV